MQSKEFYESVPLGVCVVRRDRRDFTILYVNHALLYLLKSGFASSFEAQGNPLSALWRNPEINDLVAKLKSTTPPRDFILPVYRADPASKKRWVKITISEDHIEGEDVYVLWVTDISASKDAEEKLKREVAQADAVADAKANFLATMSHEIRTPMQAVYGFLELIAEEKPPQAIQSMVDTAKHSASGLLEILDDILDFAKMDAQQMELDHFEVPVRTLVRGTLEALSVKVYGKHVALLDDIPSDVPFVVVGDPKRLRQIILNLTGNALKFTEDGSVTVHVSRKAKVLPQPKHGLILRFEIRDTGIGMSPDVCARLFKPFSQADNSTSRKYGGTGLGLSICKRLVELMGGQIGVESAPGSGSIFWFEIPTEEVSTDALSTDLPSLDGISILSVEDHPQGAREIVKSLQSMGAKVESCPTYAEALDLVKRRPFDVGVIDQGLPDGLGLDLIREIMTIRPFMGLIMYTVRDDIGLQHSLQALGVTYLSKPASRLGLGTAVKDATRKQIALGASGKTRLLIAEDNPTVRDVIGRQLARLGVEADFVANGHQALKALETGLYGILFTDLHMPEMDGYGLVQTLRQQEKADPGADHLPIVVLTADVQMVQRQVYLAEGFDECLLKPVSLGQLRRLLIRWGLLSNDEPLPEQPALPTADRIDAAPFSIDALMEQMGADRNDAVDMMRMFVEMTVPLIAEIELAHAAQDFDQLRESAHSLKGGAYSACCQTLGDLAAQLQHDSEQRRPSGPLVAQIADAFAAIRQAINSV
jgi:signal transduction histidine kinase/DNA-binding response OmpR family regulator